MADATADDAAIALALAEQDTPLEEARKEETRIDGDDFVGCRLRHYWAGDNAWYFARVLTFDHATHLHVVLYDDGEVHEVNLLDSNELYMIGRSCYIVKLPGHSPWPCMEWECSQTLEHAGTMRMWNRRTSTKMFIIYFGTEEQGLVPALTEDEEYNTEPRRKRKKGGTAQKIVVKPYIPGSTQHGLGSILTSKGRKAQELRSALDDADLEVEVARRTREDWRLGSSVPANATIVKWNQADAAGPVDVSMLSVADPGYDVEVSSKSLKRPAPCSKPCEACGGTDLDLHSNGAQCITCDKAYHLHCWGGPELLRAPALLKERTWRCADCLSCKSCARTQRQCGPQNKISKLKIDGVERDLCSDCSPEYKAGKYCPACGVITTDNEGGLVKCDACRLWTHARCEGLNHEDCDAIANDTHPLLGRQFLCQSGCAVKKTTTIVNKLRACDKLGLFALPITEQMAPTYREVVRSPMDLETMHSKAQRGTYRSTQAVRNDMELMSLNAIRFNRTGDKIWKEARRFFDEASQLFEEEWVDENERPLSVLSASGIKATAKVTQYDKVQATVKAFKSKTVLKDRIAGSAVGKILKLERQLCRDALPCVPTTELSMLTEDNTRSLAWRDLCLICGSGESTVIRKGDDRKSGAFVFCCDCGEAYHAACAACPLHLPDWALATWRCPNCKLCEACGVCEENDESSLVYCDGCDKAYHLHCLDPPLDKPPPGKFFCDLCVTCDYCGKGASDDPSQPTYSTRNNCCTDCMGDAEPGTLAFYQRMPLNGKCGAQGRCLMTDRRTESGRVEGGDPVACGFCGLGYHAECAPAYLGYLEAGSPPACPRCRSDPGAGFFTSHLGEGDGAYAAACAISEVQRLRLARRRGEDDEPSVLVPRAATGVSDRQLFGDNDLRALCLSKYSSTDYRKCELCKRNGDCAFAGRLVPVRDRELKREDKNSAVKPTGLVLDYWVHANCALWSSEVYEHTRLFRHVQDATRRSKNLKCSHCGQRGATMGCCSTHCKRNFHFRCGAHAGAVCVGGSHVFCRDCAAGTKSQLRRERRNAVLLTNATRAAVACRRARQALLGVVVGSEVIVTQHCDGDVNTRRVNEQATVVEDVFELGSMEPRVLLRYADGGEHLCTIKGLQLVDTVDVTAPDDVPIQPEPKLPPAHLQTPLATYLGDVAGAVRVASAFDAHKKKGQAEAISSEAAYEAEMRARKEDVIREAKAAQNRERERERARERASKSRKGSNTGSRAKRQSKKRTYDLEDVAEPSKKGSRGRKKKAEPVSTESAAVRARSAWLDDRCRMSLALHAQFRIGALSVFRLGEAAPAGHVGFHDTDRVFPLHYRAARMFYSFARVNCRTLYMCRVAAAAIRVERKIMWKAQFIIQAVDAPTQPCIGDTVQSAVDQVLRRVRRAKEKSMWRDREEGGRHRCRARAPPYGLCDDGSGFFGFSLPAVRARIEFLPRVTGFGLNAELLPRRDRVALINLDRQEGGVNNRRIISYRFCYVRPTAHDVLLAQRQAAIRDAQAKPSVSGSARSEPRDAIDDIARRSRITRALAQAEEEVEQEKEVALELGRQREKRERALANLRRGSKKYEEPDFDSVEYNVQKYRALRAVPVLERLAVRRSHIHGWGLYTRVDLKKDDFVIEYVGQVIRNSVADKREVYYDEAGVGSCYLFRIDDDCIVDATRRGHIGRFINHCCTPNAYARTVEIGKHTRKIVIIALKDLKAGEEVMYDYKFPIEDDKVPCYCGAPNCKGTMN